MNLCQVSCIKQLMEEAGITFRREFGQNFLIDNTVPERIAEAACDKDDLAVLEIGPGIGCLTKELALRSSRVIAVEIDRGLIPVLSKTLGEFDNVKIVEGDVMKLPLQEIIEKEAGGREVAVCANLPYYITTPILMRLLESGIPFRSITVMVQEEVADRLTAKAGSPDYGAITAVMAYYGTAKKLFSVSPSSFLPPPKVTSAVMRLDLFTEKPIRPKDEGLFFRVIHAAFGQRRKTLSNALGGLGGYHKAQIVEAIESAGLSPTVRGEKLTCEEFCRLSDVLFAMK